MRPFLKTSFFLGCCTFPSHEEERVNDEGLCSSYLCNQSHEAQHNVLKLVQTNYDLWIDALQRARSLFNTFIGKFFMEKSCILSKLKIFDSNLEDDW